MAVFRELRGVNVNFLFSSSETAHPCAEARRLTYYAWKSVRGPWCGALEKTPPPPQKEAVFDAQFRAYGGKETPWGIVTKVCTSVDIHDVITFATFGDDRLRGLGVARGRISRFPIDLRRRPYNTLALPCECVMYWSKWCCHRNLLQGTLYKCYWSRDRPNKAKCRWKWCDMAVIQIIA